MKTIPGKCHLLIRFKTTQVFSIGGTTITCSTAETLLHIIIDSELNFENHLSFLCKTVSRKIMCLG